MKSSKFISAFLLLFLLVFMSCQKDDGVSRGQQQENIPDTFSQYFGDEVSRDFLGNVIDINKNPIQGVTITIGNTTATTDSNGVFIIRDANVNERFGYIKAEKAGYIHGSRSVVPSNGTNKVKIMLLEATLAGTVFSGSSETVSLTNGSSVSFDGNFIKEDGSLYSGAVDVIMHHLDPANEDMPLQMPGMLYAENEDGAERMLQTLGMLTVELRGESGEDLNLAEGSTSEIKIPLDSSLLPIAPATIPLWYFDEVNGYWKEEGQATLQGNMYVGTVSHFSFWNWDIPAEAIILCVNLVNEDGQKLNNMTVTITSLTFGTNYGYSNENGEVCGVVPSNEILELNVYNPDLYEDVQLYSETIGPFNVDSNITIVIPDNSDFIQETVVGTLSTCDGNVLTDGYIQLNYRNQTFTDAVNIDGSFEITLIRFLEENTFSFTGVDFINHQSTDVLNYTFNSPLTNIGNVSPCNEYAEFIEFTMDGQATIQFYPIILFANFYPDNQRLLIRGKSSGSEGRFNLWGELYDSNYLGTYDELYFDGVDKGFSISDLSSYGYPDVFNISSNNINIVYSLTALGEVGEYIDINFSGSFEDNLGNPHIINGIVHVLRDE